MLIREAGIIFNGIPVIFNSYHRASKEKTDLICSSGLMSGLLSFAECLMAPIEYFESSNFSIIFKKGVLIDHKGRDQEVLAFLVLDKDDRLEKYLNKTILPLLENLLKKFTSQYNGCRITQMAQFESFKKVLDKAFGTGTLTLEEKVISLLT
ncbi:hypothetical protein LCGC14_1371940 [marine sediment metagenome]|uniref:Uncharacterized protein n=1 Tax=marine sediment metagenome TaxID=412755 RepID=A0A0F9K569_9ZZZZ|nr:MAG: hypothetical protein Lokiarch_39800 [Candidatus Lokiarchaeum sp. GC14_75]